MTYGESAEHLRALAARLRNFQSAFEHVLSLTIETPLSARAQVPNAPVVLLKMLGTQEHLDAAMRRAWNAAGRVGDLSPHIDMTLNFTGGRRVDPLTDWATVIEPDSRMLPRDVLNACERAIGRLETLAEGAETDAPTASLDLAALHPVVWDAAQELWTGRHYRQAVEAAYGALLNRVKQLTDNPDGDDEAVFGRAFAKASSDAEASRLRWPGDPQHKSVISMNKGLQHFSAGVRLAIRNVSVHERADLTAQEGAERIAALSLLAGWIDGCELDTGPVS